VSGWGGVADGRGVGRGSVGSGSEAVLVRVTCGGGSAPASGAEVSIGVLLVVTSDEFLERIASVSAVGWTVKSDEAEPVLQDEIRLPTIINMTRIVLIFIIDPIISSLLRSVSK
jgi:hypothetical protein